MEEVQAADTASFAREMKMNMCWAVEKSHHWVGEVRGYILWAALAAVVWAVSWKIFGSGAGLVVTASVSASIMSAVSSLLLLLICRMQAHLYRCSDH